MCKYLKIFNFFLLILVFSCGKEKAKKVVFSDFEKTLIYKLSGFEEAPKNKSNQFADNEKAAKLGQFLFFDARLSKNGHISCSMCHDPRKSFGDGLARARGLGDVKRNSPSLWNVAYQTWFFWDGRADSLWAQAAAPIESDAEMGFSRVNLAKLFVWDKQLAKAYEALFGKLEDFSDDKRFPMNAKPMDQNKNHENHKNWMAMQVGDRDSVNKVFVNALKSIEAYERKIVSKNAPFDQYVSELKRQGKSQLISEPAKRGLRLFIGKAKCILCHVGPNLSDGEFHNIGLARVPEIGKDEGRFAGVDPLIASDFNGLGPFSDDRSKESNKKIYYLAKKLNNLGEFKTPTLRNIEKTGPYMHAGQFASLKEVINHYKKPEGTPDVGHREESVQEIQDLPDSQIDDIIEFLKSLTDESLDPALKKALQSPY